MLILACDTSGPAASAAIWQSGRLLAESTLQTGRPHSATLLPLIESLLACCSLSARDIGAYACTVGPGSFTGIRIAVSAVKAMAFAANRPAYGISSLEAMAWPYAGCAGQIVCPILDARNQRIFAAAWQDGKPLISQANWLAADFIAALQALPQSGPGPARQSACLVVGHRPAGLFQEPDGIVLPGISLAPQSSAFPRAAAIAELADIQIRGGAAGIPQQLMPQYLSLSQAERRLAAGHG